MSDSAHSSDREHAENQAAEPAESGQGHADDAAEVDEPSPKRRASFVEHDVVYTAVGASSAPDLLRFPPEGMNPFAREHRLGSGAERFLAASTTLMTWGAQRAIGIEVSEVRQSDEDHYAGVQFEADGTPIPALDVEVQYGPDGEPFLSAGVTARLSWAGGSMTRGVRVVFTVDEPRKAGFALGTTDAEGVIGETLYLIEFRDDDSVWAIARGFYRAPEAGLFGVRGRAALRLAERDAARLIAALAPGAAKVNGDSPADADRADADPGRGD